MTDGFDARHARRAQAVGRFRAGDRARTVDTFLQGFGLPVSRGPVRQSSLL